MIACPSCAKAMTFAHTATATSDGHPDERTDAFIVRLLERDPSAEGTTWLVYESPCCGCGCRRYLPR